MKIISLFLGFLCLQQSQAALARSAIYNTPNSASIVATGGAPIPIAFSFSDTKSTLLTGMAGGGYRHILVGNETGSRICVVSTSSSTVLASSSSQKYYVPANTLVAFDDIYIGDKLSIQSDSGSTITSGTVEVTVW